MSDIRAYLKGKEKREQKQPFSKFNKSSNENLSFYDKLQKHRLTILYRILLAAVVVIGIVVIVITSYRNRVYTTYEVLSTTERELVDGATDLRLGNAILTYSKDGAHCTDVKGNALWNQTYEMQSPIISICKDTVAIGDYNGRTVYIMNASSKLGEVHTNMPIRSLQVAANGVIAVALEDTKVTWIYLYDKDGNELVKSPTNMKDSGYPLSISISSTAELAAVSYLYVDSGTMKTSVAFYNFGPVGENYRDRYVSGYNYEDTVVPYIQFMDTFTAFAVGDNRFMIYTGQQIPEESFGTFLDQEVQAVFHNEEYIGLVFLNETGNTLYTLKVFNKKGTEIITKEFDLDYTNIFFEKEKFVIYNQTECEIYDMQGMQKYKGNFEKPVGVMIPTSSSNKYTLSTRDSIDMIELR